MKEKIIGILKTQIVSSLFFIILGICLVIMPVTMVNIICKVIFGVLLICAGGYHIFLYVKANRNPNLLDFFSGVLLLVLGGFLFFNPQVVVKLLPVLLGTFILIDSIWIFQGCSRMRKSNRSEWKVFALISLIFVILSVILAFHPFGSIKNTIIFAGCALLLKGITDIVFLIYKNKKEKPQDTMQQNQQEVTSVQQTESQETESQETVYEEERPESDVEDKKTEEIQALVNLEDEAKEQKEEEALEEWKD